MLNKLQAQELSSYWHAGGRPSMQSLEQGGPTASQMRAYLSAELERHQVFDYGNPLAHCAISGCCVVGAGDGRGGAAPGVAALCRPARLRWLALLLQCAFLLPFS